jgi:hypothetical protein
MGQILRTGCLNDLGAMEQRYSIFAAKIGPRKPSDQITPKIRYMFQ